MALVDVLLSCGNEDKQLKITRQCTFTEFRKQVGSSFPHLPRVSQGVINIMLKDLVEYDLACNHTSDYKMTWESDLFITSVISDRQENCMSTVPLITN